MQWLWQSDKCRAFCEENIVQFGVTESLMTLCVQPACPINFEASESIAAASARIDRQGAHSMRIAGVQRPQNCYGVAQNNNRIIVTVMSGPTAWSLDHQSP